MWSERFTLGDNVCYVDYLGYIWEMWLATLPFKSVLSNVVVILSNYLIGLAKFSLIK